MQSHLTPKTQERQRLRLCEEERVKYKHIVENRIREGVLIEKRAESSGLMARMNQEMNELETEEKLLRAREASNLRKMQMEQEERLCKEIKRIKDRDLVQLKKRQLLRQESPELRDLEIQLNSAFTYRHLDVQVLEKDLLKIQEKNREVANTQELSAAWSLEGEYQRQIDRAKFEQRQNYRLDLQDQIIAANRVKQAAYQEFLNDRALMNSAMERVQREDELELQTRLEKVAKAKKDIEEFKAAQEVWRNKAKAEVAEENKRVQAYMATAQFNSDAEREERRKKEASMDLVREKIYRKILEKKMKDEAYELLVQEVVEGELREGELQKHNADMERQIHTRNELRATHRVQQAERLARQQREESEDKAYMQYVMAQKEANARVEAMTKEKQRTKRAEFRQEVEEQMKERRNRRVMEVQQAMYEEEKLQEVEDTRMQMVEAERMTMLKEHASKLLGYFPPGVLRETDLPLLGPEFVSMYTPKARKADK